MQTRRGVALGYVKVELLGSPRRWGWSLLRANSDTLVQRSAAAFGCAEDAWQAGQAALAGYEAAASLSRAAAREEAEAVAA